MRIQTGFMATVLALILAGCVSAGTEVTEAEASQFVVGHTTKAQVIAALGEPNSTSEASDGTSVIAYVYTRAHATAVTYVPIVGAFAGGARSTGTTAAFTFGPDGVLKTSSSTAMAANVNTGL